MRKYIWFILLCASCANNNKEMNVQADSNLKGDAYLNIEEREISLEEFTVQKFHEYFELLQLNKEHPEFNEAIIKRLSTFSFQPLLEVDGLATISLKNIYQKGKIEQVSDSVQKLKLLFAIVNGDKEMKDSVYASIISKTIQIEGVEILSSKVIFSKIE